jgi:hypothetical protein
MNHGIDLTATGYKCNNCQSTTAIEFKHGTYYFHPDSQSGPIAIPGTTWLECENCGNRRLPANLQKRIEAHCSQSVPQSWRAGDKVQIRVPTAQCEQYGELHLKTGTVEFVNPNTGMVHVRLSGGGTLVNDGRWLYIP